MWLINNKCSSGQCSQVLLYTLPMTEAKIYFFLHYPGDIDNIVPIIDAWLNHGHLADIIMTNEFDLRSGEIRDYHQDHRLQYLIKKHGIPVHHLIRFSPLSQIKIRWSLYIKKFLNQCEARFRALPFAWIFRKLNRRFNRKYFNNFWEQFFDTIVFDKIVSNHSGPHIFALGWECSPIGIRFIKRANKFGAICVGLPHGASVFKNFCVSTKLIGPQYPSDRSSFNVYHRVFFPHTTHRDWYIARGCKAEICQISGLPRYSRTWMRALEKIQAHEKITCPATEKKKLLLLLRDPRFNINEREVSSILHVLKNLGDKVEVIINPHIRKPNIYYNGAKNIHINTHNSLSSLINWADIILHDGTSAIFHAIALRKPVLDMVNNLSSNVSIFEEYLPRTIIRTRDDFNQNILRFIHNPSFTTYSEKEALECLNSLVGGETEQVTKNYIHYFENLYFSKNGQPKLRANLN